MKRTVGILLTVLLVFSGATLSCFNAYAEQTKEEVLKFNENGDFKILQIADTQDDYYPSADMLHLVKNSIAQNKPDLVVFTGDTAEDSRNGDNGTDEDSPHEGVLVEGDRDATKKNIEKVCEDLFSVVEKSGVPFAVAQGNNDHKVMITGAEWVELYNKYDGCLVKDESPAEEDSIDYHLEIMSSDGKKAAFNLWMIDTLSGTVSAQTIQWYKEESAKLTAQNGGNPVPAFVFQHVNVPEIGKLFEKCRFWDEDAQYRSGKFYRLNRDIATGYNTSVYKEKNPSAEFTAWKKCGDVIGAYFGHEHDEGFTGTYDGIEMGFTYGAQFAKEGPYGVRVITLHEDDIKNYDNVLYTYEGSVKTQNARFVLQTTKSYVQYHNFLDRFTAGVKNGWNNLIRAVFG